MKTFSTKNMSSLEHFRFSSLKRSMMKEIYNLFVKYNLPCPSISACSYEELLVLLDDLHLCNNPYALQEWTKRLA